ncbi:helix-turn-helix transcriptional regulator [Pedobacter psychroterrae]|uniref:AraC family transcriptional regulator n=1 Tax=Pedobacter psychroterrae TaxID=2530453 RepID=A0A4R0NQY5_9SPHI|nr:helix-turn-helix transcriptional regulator [Pedobacter psychroterrae]TCD03226.1 AraC family transcriptional regulator [Pedobacter psychroterrae]
MAEYGKNSANILVHFKEGGANAFLDLPLHELFESNVELDHFFLPSELRALQDQIEAPESVQAKVSIVQSFLISRLRYNKPDLLIGHAIEKIKMANGIISVKDLSENLHISIDAFEKRFRKIAGATPKQFSDIVRMKSLIAQVHFNHSLLDTALNAGFFDQSHFIRSFKGFTGQTPKEFLSAVSRPVE